LGPQRDSTKTKPPDILPGVIFKSGLVSPGASSATATATEPSAATFSWCTLSGLVNRKRPAVPIGAIECVDYLLSIFVFNLNKPKTTRTTCVTVGHNSGRNDSTVLRDRIVQLIVGNVPAQITEIQSLCHKNTPSA
jgi:hypothetical protein